MSTPIYVGDTQIEEVPGAVVVFKRGEASQLTRPFEGNVTYLSAFLAQYVTGQSTDYEYRNMVLDQKIATEDGPTAKVKLIYYGDPDGYLDPYNPVDLLSDIVWEPRSASLGTSASIDGTFTVNYFCPTITYRYCTSQVFVTPQYQTNSTANPVTITIMDFYPNPGPGNQQPGYVITGTWVYQMYAVCTSFTSTQKGNVFNYKETWAVLIQTPNLITQLAKQNPATPAVQS